MTLSPLKLFYSRHSKMICYVNVDATDLLGIRMLQTTLIYLLKDISIRKHSINQVICYSKDTEHNVHICFSDPFLFFVFDKITPSLPSFLPSPFLTCCAILPTSFGEKGSHLRR